MENQNIDFQFRFQRGVEKIRLDNGIPNMVPELGLDNSWTLFWPKQHQTIVEVTTLVHLNSFFSANIWVKHYPNSILMPYL